MDDLNNMGHAGAAQPVILDHRPVSREQLVKSLLKELGVPAHIKGYRALAAAVVYMLDHGPALMTKAVYPHVGLCLNLTPINAERNIRYAIQVGFDRLPVETIDQFFGHSLKRSRGCPSNSEFLAALVEQVRDRTQPAQQTA